jgi:hypothetical protein
MAFNGSGTFNRTNGTNTGSTTWALDRDDGTAILAARHDTHDQDIADGLTNCITKDGQTTITADIPFGTNKITGLKAGTAVADAAQIAQIQNAAFSSGTVGGTADVITLTLSPAPSAYADRQLFFFEATADNTGAVTMNVNSLGAKTVSKFDDTGATTALIAGDIQNGGVYHILYEAGAGVFLLINPSIVHVEGIRVNGATANQIAKIDSNGDLVTRTAADARSDISAAEAGTEASWSPTLTGSGSMTVTSQTIHEARYQKIGDYIFFNICAVGTIGGTPDTTINIPHPVAGTAHDTNCTFPAIANDGDGTNLNSPIWRYSGSNISVFKQDVSNWTAGASFKCNVIGHYRE